MKACTKCLEEKPLDEFTRDKRRADGRGSWCKPCSRAYLKNLYQRPDQKTAKAAYYAEHKADINAASKRRWSENKERYKVAAQKWRTENREGLLAYFRDRGNSHRDFLAPLKGAPCDFDHVRGIKVSGISQMWSWGKDKVLAEIAKCELTCANCHRVRTHSRRRGEDRLMTQEEMNT